MPTQLNKVLEHLHRVLTPLDDRLTDGQLLARFVATRDQASFAALVQRHGPMVWRVCRRVLGHEQDAEDTFQAAFLVLACKAASIHKRESVGSFLYGVAYRTALDARSVRSRRRRRERQVEDMPHPQVSPAETSDWRPWLDRELSRLPEKYRTPIILCDLEGRTRKDVARQLKVPEGTLSSRLATARRLLAKRMKRHGLALSGGALAGAMTEGVSAAVPAPLALATVRAASGQLAVSTAVAVLLKGALKTMLLTKLKATMAILLVVTALGASGLVYRASGQAATAEKQPLSEVERLRRENELLKLNLDIVLEKVRAQDTELRGLRDKVRLSQTDLQWNTPTTKLPTALDTAFPMVVKPAPKPEAKQNADPQDRIKKLEAELAMWKERAEWSQRMAQPGRQYLTTAQAEADLARLKAAQHALDFLAKHDQHPKDQAQLAMLLREVESTLKKLGEARDADSTRRRYQELDAAMKRLREELAKQGLTLHELKLSIPAKGPSKPKSEKGP
jgi:RNA polymerase sigma factor (sigma-70 family)